MRRRNKEESKNMIEKVHAIESNKKKSKLFVNLSIELSKLDWWWMEGEFADGTFKVHIHAEITLGLTLISVYPTICDIRSRLNKTQTTPRNRQIQPGSNQTERVYNSICFPTSSLWIQAM